MEVADYFGVSPEYLLGGHSESKQPKVHSVKVIFDEMTEEERYEILTLCQKWLLSLPRKQQF